MGTCLCKEKREERRVRQREQQDSRRSDRSSRSSDRRNRDSRHRQWRNPMGTDSDIEQQAYDDPASIEMDVKDLIRQTLKVIRTLVNNEQEPPQSLLKLNLIADKERGWLMVVKALIETVPDNDSLGPAVITLFLDECPLPSKETIHRLLFSMEFSGELAKKRSPGWHKNSCIVLGSLAEKLAGSTAVAMFSHDVQQYLIACVVNNAHIGGSYQMILFSLLALEKFAQTSENQHMICRTFEQLGQPLLELEKWLHNKNLSTNWLAQQVGFCAQWSLDNIFVSDTRQFAYETTDVSGINAMLNHEDVSEYLKIGPNGLEARCDVSSFESVRCTFEAVDGVWYYEATVLTPGVMQIGLATKRSRFLNHEGYGIGDDDCSVAYDGCRQLVWYNANSAKHEHPPWKQGDVVGVLLHIPEKYVRFSLNGIPLYQKHKEFLFLLPEGDGVFAAASFMSFQQCRFNFGATPFRYPPKNIEFRTFNEAGVALTTRQKTILPRRRRLEMLKKETIPEDFCTICFSQPGTVTLVPCQHSGFCLMCCYQMDNCPLCRTAITDRKTSTANQPPALRKSEQRHSVDPPSSTSEVSVSHSSHTARPHTAPAEHRHSLGYGKMHTQV